MLPIAYELRLVSPPGAPIVREVRAEGALLGTIALTQLGAWKATAADGEEVPGSPQRHVLGAVRCLLGHHQHKG